MNQASTIPARLEGVTRRYGSTVALDHIDFEIRRGELVAFLGPNGAGKTTAVHLLLGLLEPSAGTARVFGLDPRLAENRIRTGAMLQVGRVPETLKVRELIDLFSSYYPNPKPLAAAIASARLEGLEGRRFGQLSGGQKQRVLFALAICGNPELLILDEPTAGVDLEARRAIWEQIRQSLSSGTSILLTTHDMHEADALASRVVVIDRGVIRAEGTPTEIKARAFGKRVRCRTRLADAELRSLAGVITVSRSSEIVELATSDADATVRELLRHDATLSGLEIASAGLEEAFLALTRNSGTKLEEVA